MEAERRFFQTGLTVETRDDGAPAVIRGHGAVFNRLSDEIWGFREQIAPGAFDDVLNDDVRALFNHDPNMILGRTSAGTLRLYVDGTGLAYEIDPPDTQVARDLVKSMQRGDVNQSSFAFRVAEDRWEEEKDQETGLPIRTIVRFKALYDVSPVTYPAYPEAQAGVRSLEAWRKSREQVTPPDYRLHEARLRLAEKISG